ncbi:Hypothetical protein SCLAV_5037 [Streptomyces clavuligerus]|uniref:Uncharacterized protein n=1 Tax=Streptomyces clavuligerus TaxID=1901 RepID=E2PX33_STRCL|nr:Hypothetical protein SCLAV_5037 [Streptomyces clavuligerus]
MSAPALPARAGGPVRSRPGPAAESPRPAARRTLSA